MLERTTVTATIFLALACPSIIYAVPCAFSDLGPGVSLITELAGLTPYQQGQILSHVRANALLPAQKTADGLHETILFDTPTKARGNSVPKNTHLEFGRSLA